jgi:hypothetical protein
VSVLRFEKYENRGGLKNVGAGQKDPPPAPPAPPFPHAVYCVLYVACAMCVMWHVCFLCCVCETASIVCASGVWRVWCVVHECVHQLHTLEELTVDYFCRWMRHTLNFLLSVSEYPKIHIHLNLYLSVYLSVCLSIHPSIYLSVYLSLSIYLSYSF